jgi:hypothetical protein
VLDISPLHNVQTDSGAHPASYPMGTGEDVTLEVKQQGSEAEHSLRSSAEVKHGEAVRPPPYAFMSQFFTRGQTYNLRIAAFESLYFMCISRIKPMQHRMLRYNDNDNDKPIKSLLKGKGLLPLVGLARLDS